MLLDVEEIRTFKRNVYIALLLVGLGCALAIFQVNGIASKIDQRQYDNCLSRIAATKVANKRTEAFKQGFQIFGNSLAYSTASKFVSAKDKTLSKSERKNQLKTAKDFEAQQKKLQSLIASIEPSARPICEKVSEQ